MNYKDAIAYIRNSSCPGENLWLRVGEAVEAENARLRELIESIAWGKIGIVPAFSESDGRVMFWACRRRADRVGPFQTPLEAVLAAIEQEVKT